jgi:tetratricopeptide (TPR) repeat protein
MARPAPPPAGGGAAREKAADPLAAFDPPAPQRRGPAPLKIQNEPAGGKVGARDAQRLADARDLGKGKKQEPPPASGKALAPTSPCSDVARRPLAERIVVWSKRVAQASSADDLIARYEGARATCELPDWRARAALLGLLQEKVRTEGAAEALLGHFAGEPEAQKHIGHAILRRSVDPAIAAVVRRTLFDERMSWTALDEELAALATPDDRLARLRQALAAHPDDPEGEIRRVRLLAQANQKGEALAYGRRLRDRGFMSPTISLALGDLFAAGGFEEDAVRTYSEIVEFDPASPASRRLLGDVYLRHGWYPAAYRQYATLTDIAPDDPAGWLRLAAAAAGSGRVDEALRIQRKVSAAEGTPGPADPRAWARLLSAARIGRLLADPAQSAQAESLSRKLKELQIFSGPAAIRILVWEDYGATLALAALDGDAEAGLGEASGAPEVGLASLLLPASDLERLRWVVRWKSDPPGRDVRFEVTTIVWDGASFKVTTKPGALPSAQKDAAL